MYRVTSNGSSLQLESVTYTLESFPNRRFSHVYSRSISRIRFPISRYFFLHTFGHFARNNVQRFSFLAQPFFGKSHFADGIYRDLVLLREWLFGAVKILRGGYPSDLLGRISGVVVLCRRHELFYRDCFLWREDRAAASCCLMYSL